MVVSKVEVVVLGLLAEEPMHGYELLERFRDRGLVEWAEVGKASVYQTLRRLESLGFVSARAQTGEGPERRVYRITPEGRKAFVRALIPLRGRTTGNPELGPSIRLAPKGVNESRPGLEGKMAFFSGFATGCNG